ncbi:MAG TPA: CarD family transcriptional regulator [Bacillota bacterium]|jgi:CarD family transcriptional regulator|nr:CarD family transcriptional regulator [Bacillota bacterium]HPZ59470.1 CarD family transcriptional regulator [Bacillota bacterium]HQC82978.1 CarD family transcriptional regulator [Bacillota bacterium]
MFSVGDKIVYPMHGAGIIEKIEKKKILGQIREYYILRVPCGDMKIMIPVDKTEDIGIRPIIPKSRLPEVFALLSAESTEMSSNWNRRYRENLEQLKSGDICKVAEVVRNLVRTDRAKKLSTGEKKMLINAKQILISELILVSKMTYEEADQVIETAI